MFDAVPSSLHLSHANLASLHAFLRSPPTADGVPFAHLLALHTVSSTIIHQQFFQATSARPPAPSSALPPPQRDDFAAAVRFLVVQADGSFLVWQWQPSTSSWRHLSRGSFPLTHRPQPLRRVLSAQYVESSEAVVWVEEYRERAYCFLAELPDMQSASLPDLIVAQSATVIPLHCPSSHAPRIDVTRDGCALSDPSTAPSPAVHYWHAHSKELVRVPPPSSAPPSSVLSLCVHAMTRELIALTVDGGLFTLRETPPPSDFPSMPSSPFLLQPLVEWQLTSRLSPPDDDDPPLFPLLAPVHLFAFQHNVAVVSPRAVYIFSRLAGVCIARVSTVPYGSFVIVHSTRRGFSGTGSLLCTGHQLYSLIAPPLSAQLSALTAASPYNDLQRRQEEDERGYDNGLISSDTFASPTFTASFPSLSAFVPALSSSQPSLDPSSSSGGLQPSLSTPTSMLIPSMPYPSLSHVASLVSSSYGPSLLSQQQQHVLNRWIGTATAASPSELTPPTVEVSPPLPTAEEQLREALSTLQSPALPLSLIVSPSTSHWLYGHQWDTEQSAVVKEELDRWLHIMEPLKGAARQRKDSLQSSPRTPPPSSNPSSSSFVGQSHEFLDRFTPLNIALHPLLASVSSTMEYLQTVPSASSSPPSPSSSPRSSKPRPPPLPASMAIPTLPPLSSQLSKAVANRSSSHLTSKDPSLSSLTLSNPAATLQYLRSLMGLEPLQPLPSSASASASSPPPSSPPVHPNMLLLNDEIRLKKELGVFGKDIPINTAGLQRSDAMPFFELLCRLFDRLQPELLTAFVQLMEGEQPRHEDGAGQWQKPIGERDLGRHCDRALQCLPPLGVRGGDGHERAEPQWMERLLARGWLLRESGRLCEAVLLMLDAANGAPTDDIRARCDEEAIALAYRVSPEHLRATSSEPLPDSASDAPANGDEEAHAHEEIDGLRAELYHHLSRHFIDRATASAAHETKDANGVEEDRLDEGEARVRLVQGVLKGLDGRIRSLSHPHFSAQHLGLLLQQQLNDADFEPVDDG